MSIIRELDKLSLSVDFMTEEQAGQVNELITDIVRRISPPHIVDVLWKRSTQGGGVVLNPLLYLCRDASGRGAPRMYVMEKGKTGLWAWVYQHDRPAWVKNARRSGTNRSMRDEVSKTTFDPAKLDIYRETDSIVVIPLKIDNVLCGLYSLEWPTSERLSLHSLKLLQDLAQPLARICWKVENFKIDQQETTDAIRFFGDSIRRAPAVERLNPKRTGFIARPFDRRFDPVEGYLRKFFQKHRIAVQRYEHTPGRGVVVDEILERIRASHFGVAEITGSNRNVLIELGAMRAWGTPLILLRRADDNTELPFDITPFHYYSYTVKNGQVLHYPKRAAEPEVLDEVLNQFIKLLEGDPGFLAAEEADPTPRRRQKPRGSEPRPSK